jgi:hypothetical protein
MNGGPDGAAGDGAEPRTAGSGAWCAVDAPPPLQPPQPPATSTPATSPAPEDGEQPGQQHHQPQQQHKAPAPPAPPSPRRTPAPRPHAAALAAHVAASLAAAAAGRPPLPAALLAAEGMSGAGTRRLYSALCAFPFPGGCRCLQVGVWKGSTVFAALHGNPGCRVTAVDDWSEFGGPRAAFEAAAAALLTPDERSRLEVRRAQGEAGGSPACKAVRPPVGAAGRPAAPRPVPPRPPPLRCRDPGHPPHRPPRGPAYAVR